MSPQDVNDPNHWFDDSPTVPCNHPHNSETVSAPVLTKPTVAEAKKMADEVCWDSVRIYLGVDAEHWVPWGWQAVLPSRKQVAAGASWMRCEAVFPADWNFSNVRSTTGSADRVAVNPRADFWACLNKDPEKSQQPFVPCDRPHQYEETGTLAILEGLTRYPPPARLAAAAQRQCSRSVHGEDRNIAVTARWDPRSSLGSSGQIAGACFIFNKTGVPLAARR